MTLKKEVNKIVYLLIDFEGYSQVQYPSRLLIICSIIKQIINCLILPKKAQGCFLLTALRPAPLCCADHKTTSKNRIIDFMSAVRLTDTQRDCRQTQKRTRLLISTFYLSLYRQAVQGSAEGPDGVLFAYTANCFVLLSASPGRRLPTSNMDSCFLFIGMAANALVGLSGAIMTETPTKSDRPLLKTAEQQPVQLKRLPERHPVGAPSGSPFLASTCSTSC